MMQILNGAPQLRMQVADASHVGEGRRAAQRLAQAHGFDATSTGRVGIIATELGNNLLRHAGAGELLLQTLGHGGLELELIAIDRGPGMSDVERCLRDGYSTGGTAGNGLGAVSRLSSTFDLYSLPGRGTVVLSRVAREATTAAPAAPAGQTGSSLPLEFGAICIAVKGESECGDAWSLVWGDDSAALLVADGLGHGPLAAAAARAATAAFVAQPFDAPARAMQRLHLALAGTRGAAAACALFDRAAARLDYAGVGNICAAVVSAEGSRGMVSHNGTLGMQLPRAQQFDYRCLPGDRVVMHSDGISARWSVGDYAGLFPCHAAVIAAVLYRDHGRGRDDSTIVVMGGRRA
jgi:anti-sigma regulatory factor (Ser/Thr protein kinase)